MLLSQLKYFQVVAELEHISRAAEQLCVAQPSLSATIGKLEKELGVSLFHRQGRNIELNDAGRRLLVHTRFLFEQLADMEASLEKTKEIMENGFILSVSNSMFLNGWLQKFVLQNPKIRLQQRMLSEGQMIEALKEETIDVALGEFDRDVPGIARKTVVEDEYVVAIPPDHRLAQKAEIYFEDIRDENIIALPSNTIFKIADRLFAQRDCKPNIMFEGSQRMMAKMVQLNRGLLFASRQMVYMPYLIVKEQGGAYSSNHYHAVIKTISDLDCHCRLSLCWKADRQLPVMAQRFIEAMEYDYPKYKDDEAYLNEERLIMPIL